MRKERKVKLAVLSLLLSTIASADPPVCTSDASLSLLASDDDDNDNAFALSNGYVCLQVDAGRISSISADHKGGGAYGKNVLAGTGVQLEVEDADGTVRRSGDAPDGVALAVLDEAWCQVGCLSIRMSNIHINDSGGDVIANETWTFTLRENARKFIFRREGSILSSAASSNTSFRALRRQWAFSPASAYAWYDASQASGTGTSNGAQEQQQQEQQEYTASVVQMKAAPAGANFFPSRHRLRRLYALGGSGPEEAQVGNTSIDIFFNDDEEDEDKDEDTRKTKPTTTTTTTTTTTSTTVILSSDSGDPYWSGLQEVLAGGPDSSSSSSSSNDDDDFDDDGWLEHWGEGWEGVPATTAMTTTEWASEVSVFANDLDYPSGAVSSLLSSSSSFSSSSFAAGGLGGGGSMTHMMPDEDDVHALLTGVYASPAGCLCTHNNAVAEGEQVAQMATTIATPSRGYEGTYNYFDPDNYLNTAALLWSGDPFLAEQVRLVVERSGAFLGGDGAVAAGQLPHHFEGTSPVFQALSGEVQTGPNVFWVLSALNYAKSSRDFAWLKGYMPKLRLASEFLFGLLQEIPAAEKEEDEQQQQGGNEMYSGSSSNGNGNGNGSALTLAKVPGSLMIDVFLRSNFTTDTNAELVGFFREFADAEAFLGNATGAATLRSLADGIAAAMNRHLWCRAPADGLSLCNETSSSSFSKNDDETEGDHYVTQWNGPSASAPSSTSVSSSSASTPPSPSSYDEYRDFVDFDANLIACAHGVPTDSPEGLASDDGARARRILSRIDGTTTPGVGGQCRASSTFVSERYYGPEDVTDGNTGDSWCAMGRIAWFDALSRRFVGDVEGFESLLLAPLTKQVRATTWMHERLACDGTQQLNRTTAYFEYPSVAAMLLRSVRYGVELGYGTISVKPFQSSGSSSGSSGGSGGGGGGRGGEKKRDTTKTTNVSFVYAINGVRVAFSPTSVAVDLRFGGGGGGGDDCDGIGGDPSTTAVSLSPVLPNATFSVRTTTEGGGSGSLLEATSDSAGLLEFSVPTSSPCSRVSFFAEVKDMK